jgi:predicted nucleic acid-binding protein
LELPRRYWDSDIFLTWLNKEPGKYDKCRGVMKEAEDGNLEIVTSALTIAEIIYLKGHPKITIERSNAICRFFESEYIKLVNVDRYVAESARTLLWQHSLKPKDAIHVASALKVNIPISGGDV